MSDISAAHPVFHTLKPPPARRRWRLAAALALLPCVALGAQGPRARRLAPIDEAASDPSFLAFRQRLVTALERRNRVAVEAVIDPAIKVGFDADAGMAGFRAQWKLADPRDPFWRALLETLALGGQFVLKDHFCAPYVFTAFPKDLDAVDDMVVIKKGAPIRTGARANAALVTLLSYDIVTRLEDPSGASERWVHVALDDGRAGFVAAGDLRSPLDYRACFTKADGAWMLTAFLAGD